MRVDEKIHFIGKCHSCEYKFRINDSDYQDGVEIDIFRTSALSLSEL